MKKYRTKFFLSALMVAFLFALTPLGIRANTSDTPTGQSSGIGGPGLDHLGSGFGSADSIAKTFGDALEKNASGEQLDSLIDALGKVGVKGADKAGKIESLGKIKGVAGFLSNAIKALRYGEAGGKLIAAAQNRDRAAFQQIVADTLTGAAADFIAGQISGFLYKQGTASLIAGLATGGTSLILAGVEFLGGILVDQFAGDLIKEGLQKSFVQGLLLDLGGWIYDSMFGGEEEQNPGPGGGPFDGQPENGDGSGNGNGPMCPIPGRGSESHGRDRYQGLTPIKLK